MANLINSLVAAILSLLFGFYPPLAKWFESLTQAKKQLVMLGLIAVATMIIFGCAFLGYGQGLGIEKLEPTLENIVVAIMAFIQAVIANAGTYKATNYIAETFQASLERRKG